MATHSGPDAETVVVGAGIAGIGAGIALRRAGFDDFVILERADEVGGTWRDHTYPGLTVDAPSLVYSFSYAQRPDWSGVWASQAEVLDYLRSLTTRYGLRPHLRFGAEVVSAEFDGQRDVWVVRCADGAEITARYLINGSGYLNLPRMPDVEGIGSFAGPILHTSDWRDDIELRGRRVAMIGTGATAIQLAPHLAEFSAHLTIFQRTPIWLLPKPPMRFPAAVRRIFASVPGAQRLVRLLISAFMDLVFFRVFTDYPRVARLARLVERLGRWHIGKQVRDRVTREALTPRYSWGCKRPSFSNDFYPIFNRDHVELVAQPVVRVTADAVITADGVSHPVDVIICATGYQPFEKAALPTYPVRGPAGTELREFWDRHRYQAFRGFAVPGFPNYFLVFGPYSIASASYYSMVEVAARNIVRCLRAARARGASRVEVTEEANQEDLARVLRGKATSIWRTADCGGSRTYYYDRFGDTPGFRPSYHHREWWASRTLSMRHFRFSGRVQGSVEGSATSQRRRKSVVSGRRGRAI
jgi:cyclohexanone monooxygenase